MTSEYDARKVKKFLFLLAKYEDKKLEEVVFRDSLPALKELDSTINRDKFESSNEKIISYMSLKQEIIRLEKRLKKFNNLNDDNVKRLRRNIDRLKGKIKRLEKP